MQNLRETRGLQGKCSLTLAKTLREFVSRMGVAFPLHLQTQAASRALAATRKTQPKNNTNQHNCNHHKNEVLATSLGVPLSSAKTPVTPQTDVSYPKPRCPFCLLASCRTKMFSKHGGLHCMSKNCSTSCLLIKWLLRLAHPTASVPSKVSTQTSWYAHLI